MKIWNMEDKNWRFFYGKSITFPPVQKDPSKPEQHVMIKFAVNNSEDWQIKGLC